MTIDGQCIESLVDAMSRARQRSLRTIVWRTRLVNPAGHEQRRGPEEPVFLYRGQCKICPNCKHIQNIVHGL
jgi:hypothetical protein